MEIRKVASPIRYDREKLAWIISLPEIFSLFDQESDAQNFASIPRLYKQALAADRPPAARNKCENSFSRPRRAIATYGQCEAMCAASRALKRSRTHIKKRAA